jgi:hypothetical protein
MFKKGEINNPKGRTPVHADVKAMMRATGEAAAKRLSDMVKDEEAWGKAGWIPIPSQLKVLELAMERTFGKPDQGAQPIVQNTAVLIEADTAMKAISSAYDSMSMPEMRKAVKANLITQETADEAVEARAVNGKDRSKRKRRTKEGDHPRS